jgi:hypothetical protein
MTEDDSTKDLTEDLTKGLTDSEKLNLLLADMGQIKTNIADIKARLIKVEAFVEDQSRDTSPILERIYQEVAEQGRSIREIRDELKLIHERINLEGRERFDLTGRVAALESRPS